MLGVIDQKVQVAALVGLQDMLGVQTLIATTGCRIMRSRRTRQLTVGCSASRPGSFSTILSMVRNTQGFRTFAGGRGLTKFDFRVNACEPDAVIELSEQTIIAQVADRLTSKYPTIPAEILTAVVRDIHARFDGRPVREYVPLLVERFAGTELDLLVSNRCRPLSETAVEREDEAVGFSSMSDSSPEPHGVGV